ncbi:hypothetical protein [Aliarcobacter lanthieri]|uniref:hypothetical protein n=1 Tax=Aliarcobacter lanthieri TaxID=1355374 RepID=UPI00047D5D6F|nr:hypothetical protein [Aliarcobacter lanthieri]
MKNNKNLFIINSPLEFINAREAIYLFNLTNILFLVIYNRNENNVNQLKEQIKDLIYCEIIEFYPSKGSSFFKYVRLIRELRKYTYNKIFTGEIDDSNFRILIANLKKEKLFLLDEGTSTIEEYERKIKTNNLNKYKFREIRYLLVGLRLKLKDTINFFTYYDIKPIYGGEVVKNKLEYMKRNFEQNSITDYSQILFFLGQPSSIFANKEDLFKSLQNVIQKYKNKKIIYIPHRREMNLIEIKNNFNKDIEILDINQPIEQYFLNNNIYPMHVISFRSTALTTTKILFENCLVEYIKINNPPSILDKNYLKLIYSYFEKDNILEFK